MTLQSDHPAIALLARESRSRAGKVPDNLDGLPVAAGQHLLSGQAFLLRTEEGLGFLYRRGEGVTIDRQGQADPGEEALWLNGSVYAAIAAINGLMPIHASAVACNGRVIAFAGPSGAGKSTLAAALGRHGLPLLADDTLILDLADRARILCLPGHKRLKLSETALGLTGAMRLEHVGAMTGKYYAEPLGGSVREALPLGMLVWLEAGSEPALSPISGGERIARLNDDHYTADLFARARGLGAAARFAALAELAASIQMYRFGRPLSQSGFAEGVAAMVRHIRSGELA
jgi:hypothetical protein